MEYIPLIYNSEAEDRSGRKRRINRSTRNTGFTEDLTKSGKNKGGNPLEPTTTATTVRVCNGKTTVTDGPFAETKEQLGGYYLVEAKDIDEAIRLPRGFRARSTGRLKCGRSGSSAERAPKGSPRKTRMKYMITGAEPREESDRLDADELTGGSGTIRRNSMICSARAFAAERAG